MRRKQEAGPGRSSSGPASSPLFTGMRGRGILRTSRAGGSRKLPKAPKDKPLGRCGFPYERPRISLLPYADRVSAPSPLRQPPRSFLVCPGPTPTSVPSSDRLLSGIIQASPKYLPDVLYLATTLGPIGPRPCALRANFASVRSSTKPA
jgi:hypothetical protein